MNCFECNSDYMIEQHHVVPKSVGGTKTIPLCVVCHGKVHDRDFLKHRELQRKGIERAKRLGKYKGRKGGKESIEKFLKKEKVQRVCSLIVKDMFSYREIASIATSSTGLVCKVSKIYNSDNRDKVIKAAEHYYLNKEEMSTSEELAFLEVEKVKRKAGKLGIKMNDDQERELFLQKLNKIEKL